MFTMTQVGTARIDGLDVLGKTTPVILGTNQEFMVWVHGFLH